MERRKKEKRKLSNISITKGAWKKLLENKNTKKLIKNVWKK
jgi:hypothetical protein